MRYFQVPTVAFRAPDGRTVAVKARRPLPPRGSAQLRLKVTDGATLDEVATRPEAYGDGAEVEAYRIFDENAVEIVRARYDLSRLSELRVP